LPDPRIFVIVKGKLANKWKNKPVPDFVVVGAFRNKVLIRADLPTFGMPTIINKSVGSFANFSLKYSWATSSICTFTHKIRTSGCEKILTIEFP